jgi:hypothetical protein
MDDRQNKEQGGETARLPYEPPAVISEKVFETLALSCGKVNPFSCPGGIPTRS